LKYVLQIHYKACNNSAEYEAPIHRLRVAVSLGMKWLIAYGNSKVVTDPVNKACDIKNGTMDAYSTKVRKLEAHFDGLEFQHVYRDNNVAADVLSKLGSKRALVPAGVSIQDLRKPSIKILSDLEPPASDTPPQGSRGVLMAEVEDD
jgi:ribonuclease HI